MPAQRLPPAVLRRRRLTALAVVGAVLLLGGWAIRGGGGGDAPGPRAAAGGAAPAAARSAPPQLPGGGRRLFPDRRVVAFYGNPRAAELGALGIGSPRRAVVRLKRQARAYARASRPVLGALELISTVAASTPGADGLYANRMPAAMIDRYHRAARAAGALLVLDIQPGHGDFLTEVKRLERWLREPDVGLALDPEWHTPGAVPGQVIGSVTAQEVNAVTVYLARLVDRHRLPQKLYVIHEFTDNMISDKRQLIDPKQLALTMNVDGFGAQANKISKYYDLTAQHRRLHRGFKLFYREDTNLLTPADVMRLGPRPDLIVYE